MADFVVPAFYGLPEYEEHTGYNGPCRALLDRTMTAFVIRAADRNIRQLDYEAALATLKVRGEALRFGLQAAGQRGLVPIMMPDNLVSGTDGQDNGWWLVDGTDDIAYDDGKRFVDVYGKEITPEPRMFGWRAAHLLVIAGCAEVAFVETRPGIGSGKSQADMSNLVMAGVKPEKVDAAVVRPHVGRSRLAAGDSIVSIERYQPPAGTPQAARYNYADFSYTARRLSATDQPYFAREVVYRPKLDKTAPAPTPIMQYDLQFLKYQHRDGIAAARPNA